MRGNFARQASKEEGEDIVALINILAAAVQGHRIAAMKIGDATLDAKLVTALATFAGAVTGEMFGVGAIDDGDIEATKQIVANSFDNGVQAGKAKVARAEAEMREKSGEKAT